MLAASPPAQTAHQAQGSSALLPDLRLLATADFSVNKPREQNTRTRRDTRDIRFALLSVRGPWSYLRLLSVCDCVDRGGPGMVEATLASMCRQCGVRAGGGRTGPARQSPVRSRATKNPCHACAHQIVTPPRQRTPPATPTTRPQLRPCAHLACTSHGTSRQDSHGTSRQDQRCQIRDAITRCRASAPYLGRGTESPATLQSPLLRLRAPFNLRW